MRNEPIHDWAKEGNLEAIQQAVEEAKQRGESALQLLKKSNYFGEMPLVVALKHGQDSVINYLLDQNAHDVYKRCPAYTTPLVAAVFFENLSAVRRLIAIEKDLKGQFDPKQHPGLLVTAVRTDDSAMIEYLLSEGVDINDSGYHNFGDCNRYGFSELYEDCTPFDPHGPPVFTLPVIVALYEEKESALVTLLKHHPDMDKKDYPEYGSSANDVLEFGGPAARFFQQVCRSHNIANGYQYADTKKARLFSEAPKPLPATPSASGAIGDWGVPVTVYTSGN